MTAGQKSGTYSAVISGIQWAVANGMDAINLSLGGSSDSQALHDALRSAKTAGLVSIAAAGNSGTNANYTYPAAYDDAVMTISAMDPSTDTFPSWSNYGVPPIDVTAPGVGICSTTKDKGYGSKSGTSMAAPHVTGAAALFIEGSPLSTPDEVKTAIESYAVQINGNTSQHPEPLLQANSL